MHIRHFLKQNKLDGC